MTAFVTAFAGDCFAARDLPSDARATTRAATWGIGRTVMLYMTAGPLLTPAQRATAAAQLRRRASAARS